MGGSAMLDHASRRSGLVLLAIIAVVLAMAAPATAKPKPVPVPHEGHRAHGGLAVAPTAALPGALVVVTGKALGGHDARVFIAGLPATVVNAAGKKLVVEVPPAASDGSTT